MTTALVIIDVQKGMFAFPNMQPHQGQDMIGILNKMITKARTSNVPIVFVQHDGGKAHPTEKGTDGFDLVADLKAMPDDSYVTKTECGAFNQTTLRETLQKLGVKKLVIGGMQTEFCVDTAIRTGADYGYDIVAINGGHSTFDTETLSAAAIMSHHSKVWQQGFGSVVVEEDINFQ